MKKQFYVLVVLTILVNTGMGLVIPILPNYLKTFGYSAVGLSLPFTALVLARLFAKPYAGKIIRLFGSRLTLQIMFAIFGVSFFLYSTVETAEFFILLRVLEGIAEGIAAVVLMDTAINLTKGSEEKGKYMGIFSASFGVGFIIGPAVGSLIYKLFGAAEMFYFGALCGAVGVVLSFAIRDNEHTVIHHTNTKSQKGFGFVLKSAPFLAFFLPNIIRRVSFFSMMILLPLFAVDQFDISASEVGLLFSLSAVMTSALMPYFGKLSDKYNAYPITGFGLITMGLCIITFGFIESFYTFLFLYVVETIAFAIMLPAGTRIFADIVENEPQKPAIIGLFGSYIEISTLAVSLGLPLLYSIDVRLAWISLGVVCAISAVPFLSLKTRDKLLVGQASNA